MIDCLTIRCDWPGCRERFNPEFALLLNQHASQGGICPAETHGPAPDIRLHLAERPAISNRARAGRSGAGRPGSRRRAAVPALDRSAHPAAAASRGPHRLGAAEKVHGRCPSGQDCGCRRRPAPSPRVLGRRKCRMARILGPVWTSLVHLSQVKRIILCRRAPIVAELVKSANACGVACRY